MSGGFGLVQNKPPDFTLQTIRQGEMFQWYNLLRSTGRYAGNGITNQTRRYYCPPIISIKWVAD
jgi:hypothetical protein